VRRVVGFVLLAAAVLLSAGCEQPKRPDPEPVGRYTYQTLHNGDGCNLILRLDSAGQRLACIAAYSGDCQTFGQTQGTWFYSMSYPQLPDGVCK
jgi:hypothetical protein